MQRPFPGLVPIDVQFQPSASTDPVYDGWLPQPTNVALFKARLTVAVSGSVRENATAPTTINAPKICMKAMRWLSIAQPKIKANTGSMFMMALLPATPDVKLTTPVRAR